MLVIKPSNAVNAKVMSKHGKRIMPKDYQAMVKLSDISEVVLYLKNNTHYSKHLQRVNERTIHRNELERILRESIFMEIMDLCRYDRDSNNSIMLYQIRKRETSEISRFLYLLNTKRYDTYYLSYPQYLDEYVSIDLKKMALCTSYDQFADSLKGSVYYDLLKKFKNKNENIDIATIEDALDRYINDSLYKDVIKSVGKSRELEEFFRFNNDFVNIQRIHRMKKYYDMTTEEILSHLRDHGTISKKKLREICETPSYKDVLKSYADTKSGRHQNKKIYESSREFYLRSVYYYAEHKLRFSQNTEVMLMCFILLCQNELFNIINIIEGIKYNLPAEVLASVIIYKE